MIIPYRAMFTADMLPKLRQDLDENISESGSNIAGFDLCMDEDPPLMIGDHAAAVKTGDDRAMMESALDLPVQPLPPMADHVPPMAVADVSAGGLASKDITPADPSVPPGDAWEFDATKTLVALAFDEQVAKGTHLADAVKALPIAPLAIMNPRIANTGEAFVRPPIKAVPAETVSSSAETAQFLVPKDVVLPDGPKDHVSQSHVTDPRVQGAPPPPSGAQETAAIRQPQVGGQGTPIQTPSPPGRADRIAPAAVAELPTAALDDKPLLRASQKPPMQPDFWHAVVSNVDSPPDAEGQGAASFKEGEALAAGRNLRDNVSDIAKTAWSHPHVTPAGGPSARGGDPQALQAPQMVDAKGVAPKGAVATAAMLMSGPVPSSDLSAATSDQTGKQIITRSQPSPEHPGFQPLRMPSPGNEEEPTSSYAVPERAGEWPVKFAPKPAAQKGEPQMAWFRQAPKQAGEQMGPAPNSAPFHAPGPVDVVSGAVSEQMSDTPLDPAARKPVDMRWQGTVVSSPSTGAVERTSTTAVSAGRVAPPSTWMTTDSIKAAPDQKPQSQPAITMSLPVQAASAGPSDPPSAIVADILKAPSNHASVPLPRLDPLTAPPSPTAIAPQTPEIGSNIPEFTPDTPALPIENGPVFALAPSTESGTLAPMSEKDLPRTLSQQVRPELLRLSQSAPDGPVVLTLRPQELGTLTFEVRQTEQGLHLHLTVDQPATLDLLRRQGDQLIADLRQAGFAGASLSFAGEGAQNAPDRRDSDAQGQADPGVAPPPPQTLTLRPAAMPGTLDLRL